MDKIMARYVKKQSKLKEYTINFLYSVALLVMMYYILILITDQLP